MKKTDSYICVDRSRDDARRGASLFGSRAGCSARARAAGPTGAAAGGMKMGAGMMDEMAAKKKANTERIAALMAQVKSSTGEAKVAAMADVINVLLEERAAMGEHCATMMSMMKK